MIRPPTKWPHNTSSQAYFTHGLPPGSANKRSVAAGGTPSPPGAIDCALLLHGPVRVDNHAETGKKSERDDVKLWHPLFISVPAPAPDSPFMSPPGYSLFQSISLLLSLPICTSPCISLFCLIPLFPHLKYYPPFPYRLPFSLSPLPPPPPPSPLLSPNMSKIFNYNRIWYHITG